MAVDVQPLSALAPPSSERAAALRRTLIIAAVAAAALALVIAALPGAFAAVRDGLGRLGHANTGWIALAVGLEALSFLGHIILFRTVFLDRSTKRVDFAASYEITLAGHAATRLVGAAGAGGIALQAWALSKAGMTTRTIAARMAGFLVLLYSFYALTVAVFGIGLWSGALSGGGSATLTLVPGIAAIGVVASALLLAASGRVQLRAGGRVEKAARVVTEGVGEAVSVVRRRDPGLAGGVMWWVFDIAVLWACFNALGTPPPVAVIVLGYFLGLLGNALPFLGSVGGVDGGMIAALVALGADPGVTVAAVIVYRLISCWLPALPGGLAYFQLRRRVAGWEDEPAAALTAVPEPVAREPRPLAVAA